METALTRKSDEVDGIKGKKNILNILRRNVA
jgi:hypothetical protein